MSTATVDCASIMRRLTAIANGDTLPGDDVSRFLDEQNRVSRARRSVDARRKKLGVALAGAEKKFEWYSRQAIVESLRCLVVGATIDADALCDQERANRMKENITGAAAILLSHREVLLTGGITRAYAAMFTASRGN